MCRKRDIRIWETIRYGNVFYDAGQPWKTRTSDPETCKSTIGACVYLIANLSILLHPFLPFSSERIIHWLSVTSEWREQQPSAAQTPSDLSVLFSRIV